jgi:hypothetical protein
LKTNGIGIEITSVDNGINISSGSIDAASIALGLQLDAGSGSKSKRPGISTWLSPNYAPSTNPHHLTQEAVNLSTLPSSVSHPTLLFYTTGPTSTYLAKILAAHPADSPSRRTALLNFFGPYLSRLPNYSSENPGCTPSAILATGWQNDEFAGWGSYTCFEVGLEHGDEDVLTLRNGVPELGLWFAGEHTAPFVALGTVTGAWWSGEGVARRIAEKLGFQKSDGE